MPTVGYTSCVRNLARRGAEWKLPIVREVGLVSRATVWPFCLRNWESDERAEFVRGTWWPPHLKRLTLRRLVCWGVSSGEVEIVGMLFFVKSGSRAVGRVYLLCML